MEWFQAPIGWNTKYQGFLFMMNILHFIFTHLLYFNITAMNICYRKDKELQYLKRYQPKNLAFTELGWNLRPKMN